MPSVTSRRAGYQNKQRVDVSCGLSKVNITPLCRKGKKYFHVKVVFNDLNQIENLHIWSTAPPGHFLHHRSLPAPPITSETLPVGRLQVVGSFSPQSCARVCPYSSDHTGLSHQRQDAIARSWPPHNTININAVRPVEALEELSPTSILMVLPYIGVEAAV